jgi:hypothetical protein
MSGIFMLLFISPQAAAPVVTVTGPFSADPLGDVGFAG